MAVSDNRVTFWFGCNMLRHAEMIRLSIMLLERHLGFSTHVPINERVASLLSKIPGLELIEGPAHPGHMCSGLATVPGALKKVIGETWAAATAHRADTVCTIFHPCHREIA